MKNQGLPGILQKKQTLISLSEMESLLNNGGEMIYLNKKVGNCYSRILKHNNRKFFNFTGDTVEHISYPKKEKLVLSHEYKKNLALGTNSS